MNNGSHWMIWIQSPCRRFAYKIKKLDNILFYVHKVWQVADCTINKYTIDWKFREFIREHERYNELLDEYRRLGIGGNKE
jgi:hypothetical protein